MTKVDYSQTYLYKLHQLTNSLDKAFDAVLRQHADVTLSQLTLLLSVDQYEPVSQRRIAQFLDLSPAAVSRQVEVVTGKGWISIAAKDGDRRKKLLSVTPEGTAVIHKSVRALKAHAFKIFADHDCNTSLANHIDRLTLYAKGVIDEQAQIHQPTATRTLIKQEGESVMSNDIPSARKLYRGDINDAVIRAQKATGITITPSWWEANVGNNGTAEQILDRFDKAYAKEVQKRRPQSK